MGSDVSETKIFTQNGLKYRWIFHWCFVISMLFQQTKKTQDSRNQGHKFFWKIAEDKLGLSCAKLSLASAKLHTSLSSDKLNLATNKLCTTLLIKLAEAL